MTERTTRARKAPAKKTTARKAPAKKAAEPAPDSPEQDQAAAPMEDSIEFRGRQIRVRMPSPEQVLVWKRTMEQLERANINDWNGAQVLAALERLRKIIDSVMVDQADVDWVDDEFLAGTFGLKEASRIILDALAKFQNRAGRRAAAKAPVRRKKAAT